jgi:drug/metabolite transporter (DMT)-like permease
MSRQRRFGLLMAGSCAFLWGFLAIAMKIASEEVPTATIVWFRFTLAFAALALLIGARRPQRLRILAAPPLLGLVAALALLLNYLGYLGGLAMTTPSFAQILIQTAPLFLAIAGVVIFRERLSRAQALGALLAVGGFVLFYLDQHEAQVVPRDALLRGNLVLLGAAVAWATYAVLQKVLVSRGCAPQDLNLLLYALPALVLVPWVDFELLRGLGWGMWLLMIFLAANTLLAYGALGEALARLPAYQVSLIITLNPLITLSAMACLRAAGVSWVPADRVSWVGYVAALLVVIGIFQVLLRAAPGRDAAP